MARRSIPFIRVRCIQGIGQVRAPRRRAAPHLRHHAELDLARKVARRGDGGRHEDGGVGVGVLPDEQQRAPLDDRLERAHHAGEARVDARGLGGVAVVEGDALAVLAHAHQRKAQVRLRLKRRVL